MSVIQKLESRRRLIEWAAVAVLFVILWVLANFVAAFVVALFLVALVLDIDSGIPFAVALVLLVTSALLTAIQQDSGAKVVAEWSFLFLAIGVLVQLRGYIASGSQGDRAEPESTPGTDPTAKE